MPSALCTQHSACYCSPTVVRTTLTASRDAAAAYLSEAHTLQAAVRRRQHSACTSPHRRVRAVLQAYGLGGSIGLAATAPDRVEQAKHELNRYAPTRTCDRTLVHAQSTT